MSKLLVAGCISVMLAGAAIAQTDPPMDPGKIINDVGADIAARTDWFGKAVGNIIDPDEPPPPKPAEPAHHHHHDKK